jgi:hypothetical protein
LKICASGWFRTGCTRALVNACEPKHRICYPVQARIRNGIRQ